MDIYESSVTYEIKALADAIYSNLNILRIGGGEGDPYLETAFFSAECLWKLVNGQINEIAIEDDRAGECADGSFRRRVFVRTFSEFDVFIDGELIEFSNSKAKELFAVCIDSFGGEVAMKKAVGLLWEGRNYDEKVKRLYRKAVAYLNALFEGYGAAGVFCSERGRCYVDRHKIICDYFEVMEGKSIRETQFCGRYMSSYSWAEETCGILCRMAAVHLRE